MRLLAETAVWWAVTFAVWQATAPTVTGSELIVGAVCSLACALAAPWLRRANDGVWKPRLAWMRWLPMMLGQLPADMWRVWRRSVTKSLRGRLIRLDLPDERKQVSATRRAIGLLALGATPSTVIVESDPEENALVLHRLRGSPDRLDSAVKR